MNIYHEIKERNIKRYGTEIERVGALLLANLYSDRTHFIYELLQNAEDACERAQTDGYEKEYSVSFQLFKDRLEFRHNGIAFNERDVEGICGINEDIKNDYEQQIGKFGIGFKSVYAYSKSPEIYSEDKSFCIMNYVWPEAIAHRQDINSDETLIVIPFHTINLPFLQDEVTSEIAFDEIKEKLMNLGLRVLLFTNNISEIMWEIAEEQGRYTRTQKKENGYRWVNLVSEREEKEEWLIFEKIIKIECEQAKIEVAYKILSQEDGKKKILKDTDTKLVVYFPTQKETKLNFLIQGPYNTTPTREDIRNNDLWNQGLIMETATLVGKSIVTMKTMGLLDINFLSILPLSTEEFEKNTNAFHPIFQEVKKVLSSDLELLPSSFGGFSSAKDAILGGSKELIRLLSSEQLKTLFEKKNWIDDKLTERGEYKELWTYIKDVIGIKEIEPTHFAIKINKNFLEKQSDEWILNFYKYLQKPRYLWEEKEVTLRAPGEWGRYDSLKVKEIIRLENDIHICPFDDNGNQKAFLPPSDNYIQKHISGLFKNRIKEFIIKDEDSMKFLIMLGLREPDAISAVNEYILPKYRGPYNKEWEVGKEEEELKKINLKTNLQDMERISKALNKFPNDSRKEKLISNLLETELLYCRNMSDGCKYYCSSKDSIYLGEKFTERKNIELFFKGNDDIWVLEDVYKNRIDIKTLKKLGCKSEIDVRYNDYKSYNGHVTIYNYHSNHKRGLHGFDPNCEIEGLEWALENITIEKSIIIWGLLKRCYNQIKGTVETATRQDYSNAKRENQYSTMGKMLINKPWLYREESNTTPQLPSEILLENLSSEYKCPEAQMIADQLEFVKPVTKELKEKMNPEDRELFEDFEEVKRLGIEEEVRELIKKKKESEKRREEEETLSDIVNDFEGGLTPDKLLRENRTINGGWDGATPEEIERVTENYEVVIEENIEDAELITEPYLGQRSIIRSKGNGKKIESKEFLRDKYHGGHCQICNTLIDLGNGKKHFVSKRIKPKEHQRKWADEVWNLLCLCPNCYARVSHGRGNDFTNIPVVALSAREGEVVPEMVEERKGDYYIIDIILGGSKKEIFYHPFHLVKLGVLMKKSQDE